MSGGSFNYAYATPQYFADALEDLLEKDNKGNLDGQPWSPEVTEKLSKTVALVRLVGILMKEVEWLYSGDSGENVFSKEFSDIDAKLSFVLQSVRYKTDAEAVPQNFDRGLK